HQYVHLDVALHLFNAENQLQQSLLLTDSSLCFYDYCAGSSIFIYRCPTKSLAEKNSYAQLGATHFYLTNGHRLYLRRCCQNVSRLVGWNRSDKLDEKQSTLPPHRFYATRNLGDLDSHLFRYLFRFIDCTVDALEENQKICFCTG